MSIDGNVVVIFSKIWTMFFWSKIFLISHSFMHSFNDIYLTLFSVCSYSFIDSPRLLTNDSIKMNEMREWKNVAKINKLEHFWIYCLEWCPTLAQSTVLENSSANKIKWEIDSQNTSHFLFTDWNPTKKTHFRHIVAYKFSPFTKNTAMWEKLSHIIQYNSTTCQWLIVLMHMANYKIYARAWCIKQYYCPSEASLRTPTLATHQPNTKFPSQTGPRLKSTETLKIIYERKKINTHRC